MSTPLTPETVIAYFTRSDGDYVFARWGRPIAPVVFGVEEGTIALVKGAVEAVVSLVGHKMTEVDPELGGNLLFFFVRDWNELADVPDLDRLVPDLGPLLARLSAADANQYRIFRFDPDGAIRAVFVFLRMDAQLDAMPADALALGQVVQSMVLWSDVAFRGQGPLIAVEGQVILRPDIADLLRVSYDPVLPVSAKDPAHGLRLAARLSRPN